MRVSISYLKLSEFRGRRFFLLFLFLLASLIVYPYAESTAFGYYAFRVLGSVAIVLAVYAVSLRRSLVIAAAALAIPAIVQHFIGINTAGFLPILNIVLSFVFDVFIIVLIFRRVFAPRQPDSETIFGALCVYMLLGFTLCQRLWLACRCRSAGLLSRPESQST